MSYTVGSSSATPAIIQAWGSSAEGESTARTGEADDVMEERPVKLKPGAAWETDSESDLEGDSRLSPGKTDATILFDEVDTLASKPWLGEQEKKELPILSLVSLNPKTANTVDLLRGQLQVLPELHDPVSAIRTVRISCGRDPSNTIVIKDSRVSLKHFTVRVHAAPGGRVSLDVLDQSSNGTWVDGRRIERGCRVPLAISGRISPLPAAVVGSAREVSYVLLHDTKGAHCKASLSRGSNLPLASPLPVLKMSQASVPCDLEEDLRCGICTDVLHRCLTLVPCGHNFCAACLAKWRRRSSLCPGCRASVRQAVQNADVDRVVEAFLHAHPESARTPAELATLDSAACDPESAAHLRWLLRDTKEHPVQSVMGESRPFYNPLNVATPQRRGTRQTTGDSGIRRRAQVVEERPQSTACVVS